MYRKKEDLEHLINALTLSEKRYFSLLSKAFASAKKENPLYLKLFYAISEKSICSDIVSERTQINTAKRLYNTILKDLLLYHHNGSVEIVIQNLLIQVEILYNKALPKQSIILLNKAYKLAHLHEKFGILLHILQWERKINITIETSVRPIAKIAREEQQILAQLTQLTNLESIYSKIREQKRQLGYIDAQSLKALKLRTIKSPLMPALDECHTQKAIFYFHFIHALYHTMIYDHELAYQHSKKLAFSPIQFILPNDYIDGLLHHVMACLCIGRFDETFNAFLMLTNYLDDQKIDQSDSFKAKILHYKICAHLIIYNYTGNRKKLLEAINEAEVQLKLYDLKFSAEMKQVTWGNLCNAYVGVGNMDQAGNIMEWLFRKESKLVRKEIYHDLYFFRLFTLLQSKQYVLLPSMALSAYRHFKQQRNSEIHFRVELKITALLCKEHDYENKNLLHAILHKIRRTLEQYIAQLKGINNFQEHYSFYVIWAESLLQNQPFHVAARAWHLKHLVKKNIEDDNLIDN